eukprot:CRZ06698.1 hypothetical protein [Spongospora subterranea]
METVYLISNEHIPFSFNVELDSVGNPPIKIEPHSGVVLPESRFPITLTFIPRQERSYNLNVGFRIKRKTERVSLNVKGEGYAIHEAIELDGQVVNRSNRSTPISFGDVHIVERCAKFVKIVNSGKFAFEYEWEVGSGGGASGPVSVNPVRGTVRPGSMADVCEVVFTSRRELSLDALPLSCRIANVRHYGFAVSAVARKPSIDFSFRSHSFGKRFVFAEGGAAHTCTLTITNQEPVNSVSLELLFLKTKHLEVLGSSSVLGPGDSQSLQIRFTPKQCTKYRDLIQLEVNGFYKVDITVFGEGIAPSFDLINCPSVLSVGNLRSGQTSSTLFKLMNNSLKAASLTLRFSDQTQEPLPFLILDPSKIHIRPGDCASFEIGYSPTHRLMPFGTFIEYEIDGSGVYRQLVQINGSCHGVGLMLDNDTLSFGAVIVKSTLIKRVKLDNIGDVTSKFAWDSSTWLCFPPIVSLAQHFPL